MLGISFSTLAVLDWLLFFVCLSLFVFAYSVCVLISSVMKRGLNRYDIIFTMQKICQVFHCPFSCVCPFVSFLGLRLFSRFPLLSFLDLVRSALGSWTREQKWQEKRIHAYGSEVWHKQSRWLDIYTFLSVSPVASDWPIIDKNCHCLLECPGLTLLSTGANSYLWKCVYVYAYCVLTAHFYKMGNKEAQRHIWMCYANFGKFALESKGLRQSGIKKKKFKSKNSII